MKNILKLSVVLALILLVFPGCESGKITLYDKDGNEFAEYTEKAEAEDKYLSYADLALNEAISGYADNKSISFQAAKKKLLKKNATVNTYLDRETAETVYNCLSELLNENEPFATAITDTHGKIIAAFGYIGKDEKTDKTVNYVLNTTNIGSTIKPLSVYSQLIENNEATWSSLCEDSPVKVIDGENWPVNADNNYTRENELLCDSICRSTNTTAVKWLLKLGVDKSVISLKNNFNMILDNELGAVLSGNGEEILGNIAMGYLDVGCNVCQMAGYYQIFAAEGNYTTISATKSVQINGNDVYVSKKEESKVISEETAYIMNMLLQNNVKEGTGTSAKVEKQIIGGKTGTTNGNKDNWFVGFNPEYTCAVWCGEKINEKYTPSEIFGKLFKNDALQSEKNFEMPEGVTAVVYCKKSGCIVGDNCTDMEVGYFKSTEIPDTCSIH